jgi:hypothetical protein
MRPIVMRRQQVMDFATEPHAIQKEFDRPVRCLTIGHLGAIPVVAAAGLAVWRPELRVAVMGSGMMAPS